MTKLRLALAALALAACGDDGGQRDNPTPDAATPTGPPQAFVVAGMPGAAGVLSRLDVDTRTVTPDVGPAGAVGDDPVLRHAGHELLIVNRGATGTISIVDDTTLALVEQLPVPGLDPQDVAVVGDQLFAPVLAGAGVAVLTRGSASVGIIDLSAGDADHKRSCSSIYYASGALYVACSNARVYVIDPATQQIKTTLTLSTDNPVGLFELIPRTSPEAAGDLVIPTLNPADGSGCVERVTPGVAPVAAGCLFDNAVLGTSATVTPYARRLTFQIGGGATVAWVAVPTTAPMADLRAYDFTTRMLWPGPLNASTEAIGDVVACPSGDVVTADVTPGASGVRIFTNGAETTTAALSVGASPTSSHGLVCL